MRVKDKLIKVQIREYKPSDYSEVKHNLEEGGLFDPVWDSEQNLKAKIEINPGSILVAVVGNKVIGSVYFTEDGWESLIFRLVVGEKYRKQSIGSRLMAEAENRLKERGVKEVAIFVNGNKTKLRNYYTKRGYNKNGNYFLCFVKKLQQS